tara:strand:+ start:1152 stop:1379 length:228 start_codon:yes stop_codon:yes gene_type:complete
MSDIYKISQALEDMRNYYGLKQIKHVTLNMEDPSDVYITFVSNKPIILDKLKAKTDEFKYKLSLSIMIDSIFPEE